MAVEQLVAELLTAASETERQEWLETHRPEIGNGLQAVFLAVRSDGFF